MKVLLLGANGFIGMHILRELLADHRVATVYAIVRGNAKTSGAERLTRQLRKYRMELPTTGELTVLEGTFTDPRMGQTHERYDELCTEVDAVVDATGATNHTYPYAKYRKEKLGPVLDLIDFCYERRAKALHIIGSVGSEVYKRTRDFYRYSFFHCGYSKMKWVVKHLGLHARGQGAPVYTYQTPFVLGGPHTGFRDPGMQYSFWHMIWYTLQIGQIWESDHHIPVVAGDVLARAVVDNMCAEQPEALVYPVTPVTTKEIAERFGLELVPWTRFRRTLTRRFAMSDQFDWRRPWSSARRGFQHALFARSLFPGSLPMILGNIDVSAGRATLSGGPAPIDVVAESAKNIRKLRGSCGANIEQSRKDLPVKSRTEMAEIHEKVA